LFGAFVQGKLLGQSLCEGLNALAVTLELNNSL
jgi:hypothetical protein